MHPAAHGPQRCLVANALIVPAPCALCMLQVDRNKFSGPLPPAWADSQVGGWLVGFKARGSVAGVVRQGPHCSSLHYRTSPQPCLHRPPLLLQLERLVAFGNKLSGPAFPPAWVASGALSNLTSLDLANNQLTGTLPATVPWPRLASM